MKKHYQKPELNVVQFSEDVIQISANTFLDLTENDLGIYDVWNWEDPFWS